MADEQNNDIPGQIHLGEVPKDGMTENPKPIQEPQKQPVQVRGLETYASDMAEAMREQEGSVIKIAMVEQKKRAAEEQITSPKSGKNKLYIVGGIGLVVLAVVAIVIVATKQSAPAVNSNTPTQIQSIIYSDAQKEIDITNFSKEQIARAVTDEIKKTDITADKIENVSLVNTAPGDTSISAVSSGPKIYSTASFFKAIESGIASSLLRALDTNFMMGIYHAPVSTEGSSNPASSAGTEVSGKHLFILLPVVSHDEALAGMLTWEKKMFDDFFLLFNIDVTGAHATLFQKPFTDALIDNLDARVLKDDAGNIVLMYVFPTDNMILITDNIGTVTEVTNRLRARKIVP